MPGLSIPTLVKAGCLEQDTINILNTAFNNTTSIVATNQATAQGFAVFNTGATITLLPSTAAAGTYRVSSYVVITTTFVTNTTVTGTFGWTDDNGAQTAVSSTSTLTAGTTFIATQLIRSAGGAAITWKPGTTGTAATAGAGAWSVIVERVI